MEPKARPHRRSVEMPERTYYYPPPDGVTQFCEPSSASGHNLPKRPPPMRPRAVFRVAPIRMRSDLVVYSSLGDVKDLRICRLVFPPVPLRWVWQLKYRWVRYLLFGCLLVQRSDQLGVVIISFLPPQIREMQCFNKVYLSWS